MGFRNTKKNLADDQEVLLFLTKGTRKARLERDRNLSASISHQLGFGGLDELFRHIQTHEKKHGNLLIILDGFDKFMKSITYQKEFAEFLSTVACFDYIKTIVSLRPDSISLFNNSLLTHTDKPVSAALKHPFYIDIEELTGEEIIKVVNSLQQTKVELETLEPSLFSLLRKPLFLGTYSILITIEKNIQPASRTVFYRLLHLYFQNRIFLGRNSSNKVLLLKNIASNKSDYHVDEQSLLNLDDLIEDGTVISTYEDSERKNAFVHFANKNVSDYFFYLTLRDQWLNLGGSSSFYNFLKEKKQTDNISLLEWAVFYACKDKHLNSIQNLFYSGCPTVCADLIDFLSTLLLELHKSREISLDNTFNDSLIHILLTGDRPGGNMIELLYLFSNDLSSPEKTFYANLILAKNLILNGNVQAVKALIHDLNRGREVVREKFIYNPVVLIKEMVGLSKQDVFGFTHSDTITAHYQNLIQNVGLKTNESTPNLILENLFQQYFKMISSQSAIT
ncbi:hypothetical protein ACJVDH_11260 [Pedobacter sp. AW1-32]|uniref:hypothetical protein n=1 Tax=Pedobacter sp. AW1-32 TaxID=3383026 RepID=UPI003FF0ACE0